MLHSSEANEITSVPHVLGEVKLLHSMTSALLDGELYAHLTSFGDITSITSRTVNIHPNHELIEYHVFDIVDEFHIMWQRAVEMVRMDVLIDKHKLHHLKIVPTLLAESLEQVMGCMEKWIEEGYEGIIIRRYAGEYKERKSTDIMKIKKRIADTAFVYASIEEETIHHVKKGTLGAVRCELRSNGVKFKVGTGFTAQERVDYWPHFLHGKWIKVEYQELTPAGVPYAPSFKGIVS